MSKTKKLLIALMLLIAVLLLPNIVNAAVEYTRSFPSDNGTIKIHFTGLNLEQGKVYKYAIVRQNVDPTEWFSLDDGYTTETATITLSPSEQKIENILKATDTAYVYIKGEDDAVENSVLNEYPVNLKLPYLQSLQYTKTSTAYDIYTIIYGEIGANYDWYDKVHWQIQKVTDRDFINKFLENKNDVLRLESYLPNPPTSGGYSSDGSPKFEDMNDGLYLVWVYRVGTTDCKTIYSCIIHDGLPDATTLEEYVGVVNGAPKIEKIRATGSSFITNVGSGAGNSSWEYHEKPNNQITIAITFDQAIVKNTAPTLTIKFGTGNNIELTTCEAGSNTLTYTYKVKQGDLGTLQIVSFTGGNVTNNEGTAAVLTLPELSGYKVVAVEGDANGEETPEGTEDTKKYISFPFIIYFGTTTIDLKSGVYNGEYTMYYQFVEVTNEDETTNYDDSKWIEMADRKPGDPTLGYTGEKKFDLWIKLVMEDETVYESYRYKFTGSSTVIDEAEEQDKPTITDKDNTTAKEELPKTGRVLLFWIIGIVAVSGIVARIRYKKLYM